MIITCETKVSNLWDSFKTILEEGISKYVPHKLARTRNSLSWITPPIKRYRNKLSDKIKSKPDSDTKKNYKQVNLKFRNS
jgi:hypothetical protein